MVFRRRPLGLLVTFLVMVLVTFMKLQTGVRVEAEVWRAYRMLCRREKLRVSLPIEEFLRFMVENDSALSVLGMMREVAKSRGDGYQAYARVLLDWYTHGKYWFPGGDDQAPVEPLLLDALKLVADAELRGRIEEALMSEQRRRNEKAKEAEKR